MPNSTHSMTRPSSVPVSPRPSRSRTHSISSDRPSTVGHYTLTCPPAVSPDAAFIARSAACQIVTNDHDSHASTWYDQNGIDPSDDTAVVSEGALQLVNSFLDHLLFNFLQAARATTLSALRPAVTDILKPKLAKDTIGNADEELHEYLGGADEEDYVQPQGVSRGWDLELVWKRTRLRCMVYSSLGDMEEEDEDMYMEQEDLEVGVDEQISDVISPAVAIFLTSVMEYMGELTLTVAGQAAYHRIRSKIERELKDGTRHSGDVAPQIVVEELDMERVALDRTLGRLWRGWKKRLRGPAPDTIPRPFSRSSFGHSKQEAGAHDSLSSPKIGSDISEFRKSQEPPRDTIVEDPQPVDIPLPMGERDVDEIEVPGLVHYSDEENSDNDQESDSRNIRPKSLFLGRPRFENGLPTPSRSRNSTNGTPVYRRKRPVSMPVPRSLPFLSRFDSEDDEESDTVKEIAAEDVGRNAELNEDNVSELSDEAEQPNEELSKRVRKSATVGDEEQWDSEEPAEYEEAEILTSSRVSMGSISSPSISGSGSGSESGKRHPKRTSSVGSARIIEVTGPKSPTRPTSLDVKDSPSAAQRVSVHRKQKSLDSATLMSSPRSPIERLQQPIATATISESEEDTEQAEEELKPAAKSAQRRSAQKTSAPRSVPEKAKPSKSGDRDSKSWPLRHEVEETREAKREQPKSTAKIAAQTAAAAAVAAGATAAVAAPILSKDRPPAPPKKTRPTIQTEKIRYVDEDRTSVEEEKGPAVPSKAPAVPSKAPGRSPREAPKEAKRTPLTLESIRTKEAEEISMHGYAPPRPIHTSVSSTSSITGRLKPVRISEDNSSASRSESVARDFEELIQSNQTISFTLTPESMRDANSKRSLDSPVVTKLSRKSEEWSRSPITKSSPGLPDGSSSPASYKSPGFGTIAEDERSKPSGPVPRAPAGIAVTTGRRGSGVVARDARVPAESTKDFAQFIKDTGPGPAPSRDVARPASRNVSSPVSPSQQPKLRPASSASNMRNRYQPREANTEAKNDNRDLLDFIRQGPPIAASNHRIPRHIAPFRTTMDSDQLNGVTGGKAVDANIPDIRYSQGSTNATENSVESSMHSNTALLKNKGAAKLGATFDEDDIMPKRKTRRVRDPYALDFSDEDDDLFEDVAPKRPVKKEESLAEFLRNYDPPPEPVQAQQRVPKKKSSAPSLITRFARSNTRDSTIGAPSPVSPPTSAIESRPRHSSAGTARSSHIPIQVNMPPGYGKYGVVDEPLGKPRVSTTSSGRVPMKKFEPREAATGGGQTAELASFFRNQAPPPTMRREPSPPPVVQESSGFSRMFGRKKKSTVF